MITSRGNDRVKAYKALLARPEPTLVGLEGHRLISDCVYAGASLTELFVSPRGKGQAAEQIEKAARQQGANILEVTDEVMDSMADTDHPAGIAAVARWMPAEAIDPGKPVIALDGVQDPGNVGTILRSAAAFGFGSAILGERTARAYSPKVARSSMGAIYRVNVIHVRNLPAALEGMKECGFSAIGLDMEGRLLESYGFELPFCLIVGSEGEGISDEVEAVLTAKVAIGMREEVESLNASVAASIAMWAAAGRKQKGPV